MQRYVMCPDCTKMWEELAALEDDGSTTKYVHGQAKKPMRCDGLCNRPLSPGEECCALTVTQPGGPGYAPWEDECLQEHK